MSSINQSTPLSKSFAESTTTSVETPSPDCETNRPRVFFNMQNLQRLAWFFAVGFKTSFLPRFMGANAAPTLELSTRDALPTLDIFYKGEHYDNTTGYAFELYAHDDSIDDTAAFASYMAAYSDNTTILSKRDWYNCKHLSNLQTLGCNSGHALGGFVSATGSAAMGSYVGTLLSEAFSGGRDNKNPRSVCLTRDGKNLCVSWATYTGSGLKGGESGDITYYSTQCALQGGSSEFKTSMADGGILYICVSDRADGCGKGVCGQ
ncbi:unnamed protein product [Aureobasidium pullulans]|nr:unnamed protein product [Aureobasidium pullulans]